MIELFKPNGQLKARVKLLADLSEVNTFNAKQAWDKTMQEEYELLDNPKTIIVKDWDEELQQEVDKEVSNPDFIEFDTWLSDNGKEFVAPETTEDDLDAYLASQKDYRDYLRKTMTVEVSSGKVFDADMQSRLNISDAILLAGELNQTETVWRLADNTDVTVTIDELKEARLLAIQKFATISGIQ